jgi:hypothetical protein
VRHQIRPDQGPGKLVSVVVAKDAPAGEQVQVRPLTDRALGARAKRIRDRDPDAPA